MIWPPCGTLIWPPCGTLIWPPCGTLIWPPCGTLICWPPCGTLIWPPCGTLIWSGHHVSDLATMWYSDLATMWYSDLATMWYSDLLTTTMQLLESDSSIQMNETDSWYLSSSVNMPYCLLWWICLEPTSEHNNNVHLSCVHQRPEHSHDTY